VMGKGKELEFPEGRGGGKGEPPVPPTYHLQHFDCHLLPRIYDPLYQARLP